MRRNRPPVKDAITAQSVMSSRGTGGLEHLLADEQYVDGAQVEVVEKGQSSQPIVSRVLSGIEL